MRKNKHIGSKFEDFLKEEGIFEEVEAAARKRVHKMRLEAKNKSRHSKVLESRNTSIRNK
jgi:hypothetical protein